FAALLHDESAGCWRLAPTGRDQPVDRAYETDTMVLRTRWETDSGIAEVVDFMPLRGEAADVVRIVEGVSGQVHMETTVRLRFDYGRVKPWVRRDEQRVGSQEDDDRSDAPTVVSAVAGPDSAWLSSDV